MLIMTVELSIADVDHTSILLFAVRVNVVRR